MLTSANALNAGAEQRAIWPNLNVATWRKARRDHARQQICGFIQIIP